MTHVRWRRAPRCRWRHRRANFFTHVTTCHESAAERRELTRRKKNLVVCGHVSRRRPPPRYNRQEVLYKQGSALQRAYSTPSASVSQLQSSHQYIAFADNLPLHTALTSEMPYVCASARCLPNPPLSMVQYIFKLTQHLTVVWCNPMAW